jgi:hypothetical protein
MLWKHEIPNTIDDIQVTRQATLQPEWAIAERLETICALLERIADAIAPITPPA